MGNMFTIGELARAAGVNIQTIRYYERRKLLKPVGKSETGYRQYNQESLKRLNFIRSAKELGFTLKEAAELLEMKIGPAVDIKAVRKQAETKLKAIEKKIESLESVKKVLNEMVIACKKKSSIGDCPILKSMLEGHINKRT